MGLRTNSKPNNEKGGLKNMFAEMSCMFYAEWFKKDVSPNLTEDQKRDLLKKLSDYSLECPFWTLKSIPFNKFPELKPFAHTKDLTGSQLFAVMHELFNEVSPRKLEAPYPSLTKVK
jgi:hypothetical protein